jgi:hypothetical protein
VSQLHARVRQRSGRASRRISGCGRLLEIVARRAGGRSLPSSG